MSRVLVMIRCGHVGYIPWYSGESSPMNAVRSADLIVRNKQNHFMLEGSILEIGKAVSFIYLPSCIVDEKLVSKRVRIRSPGYQLGSEETRPVCLLGRWHMYAAAAQTSRESRFGKWCGRIVRP